MVLSEEADRLVSNATNVPRANVRIQVARVGGEKNHVCIYISAGINHSTEKSRHKTQTGYQRGTAHPLNTQWPYVAGVRTHARLPPCRKMLLLFTGELRTRHCIRFIPSFMLTWSLHGSLTTTSLRERERIAHFSSTLKHILFLSRIHRFYHHKILELCQAHNDHDYVIYRRIYARFTTSVHAY